MCCYFITAATRPGLGTFNRLILKFLTVELNTLNYASFRCKNRLVEEIKMGISLILHFKISVLVMRSTTQSVKTVV